MWYGKDTSELIELKEKYEKKFGYNPDGEMELEYGQSDYKDYVRDIKRALVTGRNLADFVEQIPPVEYDWWSSYIQKAGKEEVL